MSQHTVNASSLYTFTLTGRCVRAKDDCACNYDWTWSTGLLISKKK